MKDILIEKLKNNDDNALDMIIEKYSAYIYTVVRNFSKNTLSEEDIEEIISDTFVALWKSRDKLDSEKSILPYLSVISKNFVKNKFRSMKGYKSVKLEEDIPTDDFMEQSENNFAVNHIYEALDTLSENQSQVFVRYYFYGESSNQISKIMKISIPNVKTTLHRARKQIIKYLTERGYN